MFRFLLGRLATLPLLLLGLSLLVFVAYSLLSPLQRASLFLSGPQRPETLERAVEKYGLEDPWPAQYGRYLVRLLRGDLGWSHTAGRSVAGALGEYLPASLELALWTLFFLLAGGVLLGVVSAYGAGGWVDRLIRTLLVGGWSVPPFVVGLVLLMALYAGPGWLPPGRLSPWAKDVVASPEFHRFTRIVTVDALLNLRADVLADALRHLVLPVATLCLTGWAVIARTARGSVVEVLSQEFVRSARARGLPERAVLVRHVLRSALLPVVPLGGLALVFLVNGLVVVEVVFDYRGLGWWFVRSAVNLDMMAVLGVVLVNGVLVVLSGVLTDLVSALLDPRIRAGGGSARA